MPIPSFSLPCTNHKRNGKMEEERGRLEKITGTLQYLKYKRNYSYYSNVMNIEMAFVSLA